ncbi:hypothetical protein DFH05DRAFT_1467515 [Lentinula detonsa]|uniref:Uncharacterized protein n=1 Tax=Lentinula detonsa TaxID=2804962 RepID=A0A9W8U347_9AGAR|nr:hypothetical protein DFH05DRAFT_1467515 [Lentinula detonsa]
MSMMEETMQVDDFGSTSISQAPAPAQPTESGNLQTPLITREIQVKVHIRRPERDSWVYMGRGLVSQEVTGHSSRVVVRALTTNRCEKGTDLQAEKRGNFVVIGCVEDSGVVSWSLNALNNSETLRLLASIELACYKCKNALTDPRKAGKDRKKVDRIIKDDRRRRHRRRKDQEALIDAFARSNIATESTAMTDDAPAPS